MDATKLYDQLEKDFITSALTDEWANQVTSIADFVTPQYQKRFMGLVCDHTKIINKVYTAVFPSNSVMQAILDKNETNILLFVHHPATWDVRRAPQVFTPMNRDLLQKFKDHQISIYNLHVPLDSFGKYSTTVSLAKKLNLKIEKKFAPYFGALCGIIGETEFDDVSELVKLFELAVGHRVSLYQNGLSEIKSHKVAVVAGGGNDLEILKEIFSEGINTFITGIAVKNNHSLTAHDYAQENKINILGGTHYSTEKFACQSLCQYFQQLGLPSEFVVDLPVLEDL